MGQQSVGKSFALNHLVNTSFASSTVRTTGMLFFPTYDIGRTLRDVQRVYGYP